MYLRSKLPDVGTTIFNVMTKLANEHKAINLSQGFPDFDCAPELIALVDKYMRAGHNQYAPMQFAYAEYMLKKQKYLELPQFYQQKRDTFLSLIKESRFRLIPCHGTYFQMLDYSEISNEPDFDFAERLTAEYNVAAIPPSVFYHDRHDDKVLRFCFAKKDETLERAAEELCKI